MKEKKLKELENSFEEGLISREEYENKKNEIEEMPEEEAKEKEVPKEEPRFKSDKILVAGITVIIAAFAAFFVFNYLNEKEAPKTIEDLHELNYEGKLDGDEGYIYNDAYSFVKYNDFWYTQLRSPQGSRQYNIQFRYGPREVEDIPIDGTLNTTLFNNASEYYVTFNPTGTNFSAMTVAAADFNEHMTKVFFKQPTAACDRNKTQVCATRPIITCGNTDKVVFYINESDERGVIYDDNCIIVHGRDLELVKGVDKALLNFYDIIERQ